MQPPSVPEDESVGIPRAALAVLVLVLLGAVAFRTVGLDYLLPHLHEPDPYVTVQTDYFQGSYDEQTPTRHFFYYPLLLARTLLVAPGPVWDEGLSADAPLEQHLAQAGSPLLRARWLVALLACGIVPATWLLARRFLSSWEAVLAAAWMATASLHLLFSVQGRPHGAGATFTSLTVVAAIALRRRPTAARYLLTGALAALALCTLQNGAAALLPLAAAHLLRERASPRATLPRRLGHLALAVLPIAAFVPLFYPFGIEKPQTREIQTALDRVEIDGTRITYGGHLIDLADFDGSGAVTIAQTVWWHDPALVVMAAVGLLVALGRRRRAVDEARRRDLWVLLAHALPYAFVIGLYAKSWDRYALPLYPYLACLAALGVGGLAQLVTRRLRSPGPRRLATAVVLIAALALPTYAAWHRTRIRLTPDTVEAAAEWVREHVRPGERVALLTYRTPLPLFYEREAFAATWRLNRNWRLRWLDYQHHLPDAPRSEPAFAIYHLDPYRSTDVLGLEAATALIDELDAAYVVTEDTTRLRALSSTAGSIRALSEHGELVARFVPRPGIYPDRRFRDYQDEPRAGARTLQASRLGPVMEIYRWRGDRD